MPTLLPLALALAHNTHTFAPSLALAPLTPAGTLGAQKAPRQDDDDDDDDELEPDARYGERVDRRVQRAATDAH